MIERRGAAEIGEYGYTHWSGKSVTPGVHQRLYVPQTVANGWDCFCSCGEWRAFGNFYEHDTREGLLGTLEEMHLAHLEGATDGRKG